MAFHSLLRRFFGFFVLEKVRDKRRRFERAPHAVIVVATNPNNLIRQTGSQTAPYTVTLSVWCFGLIYKGVL